MTLSIIVAVADNGAIGKDNQLLWHLSEDLKFFKRTTSGHPVIMGSNTFRSLGRPLPKRRNLVVSRKMTPGSVEGIEIFNSLNGAIAAAEAGLTAEGTSEAAGIPDEIFIIGGGMIYREAMERADRLYITEVHTVIGDADTFFPEIDPEIWKEEERSEPLEDEKSGYRFQFVKYHRKQA